VSQDQHGMMQMTLARDASGKSPGDYLVGLTTDGKISGSRGGPESLGDVAGVDRHDHRARRPGGPGGAGRRVRARDPDLMLQVLGRGGSPGDANERAIIAAIRSMTVLSDPRRGMVQPARIRVQAAPAKWRFPQRLRPAERRPHPGGGGRDRERRRAGRAGDEGPVAQAAGGRETPLSIRLGASVKELFSPLGPRGFSLDCEFFHEEFDMSMWRR
jgi:hypothetical protein